ncbi:MAG: hypothetical protein DLM64_00950 [Solirubrobacterales bacterium]|nr:MAG: hypothetical protein DLM64_00950 [Solirubrobacterales bacterium]
MALFGVANIYVIGGTQAPSPRSTAMTIDVIGHQWWWEIRYPGSQAVTANEIHIPVGTRVNVVASTADRYPQLLGAATRPQDRHGPGQADRILLEATRAGVYRGQCAEFCGFQHANTGAVRRRAAARRTGSRPTRAARRAGGRARGLGGSSRPPAPGAAARE